MAVTISGDFGFVALVVVWHFVLNMYMNFKVVNARRKYNVQYPALYAVEAENKQAKAFNCVQRGHQNFLEYTSFFLSNLILGGIQHPKLAAGLGACYVVSRFFYFKGYSSGVPANRLKPGGSFFFFLFALAGCTVSFAISLISTRRE